LAAAGRLAPMNVAEDTFGSAPARDERLERNGCTGTASAVYDAKSPLCNKYADCPAAFPVVWCEFPGGNDTQTNYENVDYANAIVPFLLGLPTPYCIDQKLKVATRIMSCVAASTESVPTKMSRPPVGVVDSGGQSSSKRTYEDS
jgi:hypothetical protein